jgi:hypothetical protein
VPSWILLIAVLLCPAVMGTMMLLMWRGMRTGNHQGDQDVTASGSQGRARTDRSPDANDAPPKKVTAE